MKRRAMIAGLVVAAVPAPLLALSPAFMVFFDDNSIELSVPGWRTIMQACGVYKAAPQKKIVITGHSALGEQDRMTLSLRRARAVMSGMTQRGCPSDAITMIGYGDGRPLIPGDKGAREMQNRRVEIVITLG
jgi:outer membrane protein OmpA-like peptidoglycan-associated protein